MVGREARLVFHYAPWAYLPKMVASGCLRASNAGAPRELPLIWFSLNQQWEPTATKTSGGFRRLTFQEQLVTVGCIRFGLAYDDPRLMPWKRACATAGTRREDRRSLEKVGKRVGGDPEHWFAIAGDVPLSDLDLEIFGDGSWRHANPIEMADVWTKHVEKKIASS